MRLAGSSFCCCLLLLLYFLMALIFSMLIGSIFLAAIEQSSSCYEQHKDKFMYRDLMRLKEL